MSETYSIDVTGEQALELARLLSILAQLVEQGEGPERERIETLVPVGEQCAAVATEAGLWEDE